MFPGLGAGHHGLVMQGIRRGDDHEVDVGMLHDFAPVVGQERRAVFLAGTLEQFAATGAQGDDVGSTALADFGPVRCPDKTGCTDHADVELKLSRVGFVFRAHAAVIAPGRGRFNHKFPRRSASITAALSDPPSPSASARSSRD